MRPSGESISRDLVAQLSLFQVLVPSFVKKVFLMKGRKNQNTSGDATCITVFAKNGPLSERKLRFNINRKLDLLQRSILILFQKRETVSVFP